MRGPIKESKMDFNNLEHIYIYIYIWMRHHACAEIPATSSHCDVERLKLGGPLPKYFPRSES